MAPEKNDEFSSSSPSTASIGNTLSTTDFLEIVDSQSKLTNRIIPKVPLSSIHIDLPFLGRGSFSNVHRIRMAESCPARQQNEQDNLPRYFAMKALNAQSCSESSTAAIDLALEGDMLSRLHHPNIIQLHAISCDDDSSFLILDLLDETLEDRIRRWKLHEKRSLPSFLLSSSSAQHILSSRIHAVALGVAKAMKYVHENNVILRDLKPENIGFDHDGTVKLFDFGFAREVHVCDTTEVAGSFRYMAPEQLQAVESTRSCKDIHLASDVYSFALVLWELCTLKKPYNHVRSKEQLIFEVVHKKTRPSLKSIPSTALRNLISKCWDPCPLNRPDFATICRSLENCCCSKQKHTRSRPVQICKQKRRNSWFSGSSLRKENDDPSIRSETTNGTDLSLEDIFQNSGATIETNSN